MTDSPAIIRLEHHYLQPPAAVWRVLTTPELFAQVKRQDRATKLLNYLGDVTVTGHPEARGRPKPQADAAAPEVPYLNGDVPFGSKQLLEVLFLTDQHPRSAAAPSSNLGFRQLTPDPLQLDAENPLVHNQEVGPAAL